MTKYENWQEVADKLDWEGGLESFLRYGFDLKDVPEYPANLYLTTSVLLRKWKDYSHWAEVFMQELRGQTDE